MISSTMRNSPLSILHNSDNRVSICRSASYTFSLLTARHLPSIAFPMKGGAQFFHHTHSKCSTESPNWCERVRISRQNGCQQINPCGGQPEAHDGTCPFFIFLGRSCQLCPSSGQCETFAIAVLME